MANEGLSSHYRPTTDLQRSTIDQSTYQPSTYGGGDDAHSDALTSASKLLKITSSDYYKLKFEKFSQKLREQQDLPLVKTTTTNTSLMASRFLQPIP